MDERHNRTCQLGSRAPFIDSQLLRKTFRKSVQEVLDVRHFSEREAARLSWECYQRYMPNQDAVKSCKIRSAAIKKCHVADTGTIEKWIKKLVAKIKLASHDSNVDNANLMKELNKLSREQGIVQKPFNQLSVQC